MTAKRMAGLCIAMLCVVTPTAQAQNREHEVERDSVQLTVTINAIYDDSDSSLNKVALLAEALPPTVMSARRYANLRDLVVQAFGVSPGHPQRIHDNDLPRTYELLVQKIKCLNQLSSDDDRLPHRVLVPSVPRRALSRPGEYNLYNRSPVIAQARLVATTISSGECGEVLPGVAFGEKWRENKLALSPAGHFVQIVIWLNEEEYAQLSGAVGEVLNAPLESKILFQSMALSHALGADTGVVDHMTLPDAFKTQLKSNLESAAARRTVPLYILDSGWPDENYRNESVTALKGILTRVRRDLRLPPKQWSLLPAFKKPTDDHSLYIADALKDLRALDPHKKVQVIFVPTTLEQGGGELLTELVFLHQLIDTKNNIRANIGVGLADTMPVDPGSRDTLRKNAQRTVARFPRKVDANAFVTDKAILEGLIWVAQHVAERDRTLFFINMSWTVASNAIAVAYPSPLWGLQVAAAGNNSGLNIFDSKNRVDFASRSANPGSDVMAVMTMDRAGDPRCASAEVIADSLNSVLAVGYDGWVGGKCGTSFAAPRVAWFLAVDEVFRTDPVDPDRLASAFLSRLAAVKTRQRLQDLLFLPPGFFKTRH